MYHLRKYTIATFFILLPPLLLQSNLFHFQLKLMQLCMYCTQHLCNRNATLEQCPHHFYRLQAERRCIQYFLSLITGQLMSPEVSACSDQQCAHPRARIWVKCVTCHRRMHCVCAGVPTKSMKQKRFTFTCKECRVPCLL